MPKILTFIHTAQVHAETFDALRDRIAPGVAMHHHIRTHWLERAQDGITPDLEQEIAQQVAEARGPVICTFTTIGAVAAAVGAMRIDVPMMQRAAETGGPILMAYCLESTRETSMALLQGALDEAGNPARIDLIDLTALWPFFEAGRTMEFSVAIARAVQEHVQSAPDTGCVVLAQASMAGAAGFLLDLPCPVLASPELALRAGLARL